ncbi:uncharacterized protein DEA37_0001073, partial [Paragonimus westermani]
CLQKLECTQPSDFYHAFVILDTILPAVDGVHQNHFTFSTLNEGFGSANLIDECGPTDEIRIHFRHVHLMFCFSLQRFADQEEEIKNHVYTKCLGLLNNVAEVEETRNTLLVDSLMDFFFKMLRHPNIQISYFAAGIIAHLSCLKDEVWHSALQSSKETYIKILGQSVCSWKPPQSEMVAYRSFEPFEKVVLHPESRLEVHLWAVWAIHHILTRKDLSPVSNTSILFCSPCAEARYVPTLCHCERLLNFLRYVVSVDETVLCANCLQRQTPTSSPQDPPEEQSITMHFSAAVTHPLEPDSTSHSCSHSANLSQSSRSGSALANGSTDFSGSFLPSSAGDGFPPKRESDTMELCKRERLHGGPAPRIGITSHSELVGQTTAGVFAFAGPDSAQLACARLIRSLAFEIVAAVDRTLSGQPTASSPDVITLPS